MARNASTVVAISSGPCVAEIVPDGPEFMSTPLTSIPIRTLPVTPSRWLSAVIRETRPRQWPKNLLVFAAPLVARAQQAQWSYKYANNLPDSHPMNVRAREMAAAIKDQTGAVKVPAGKTLTDPELQRLNWYVEGVDGSLPK